MSTVRVLYFSDILCVWAYIGQVRVDELRREFDASVQVEPRFCSVFADVPGRMEKKWAARGGAAAYAQQVREAVGQFDHVAVHADVWSKVQPYSSTPCHVFLCAIRILEGEGRVAPDTCYRACGALRDAFFLGAREVGTRQVQLEVAEATGVSRADVEALLDSGRAHAELAGDFELASSLDVKVSPSLVLNEGRQRLNGHVGFRVIEANVRELMHKRGNDEASWC